MQRAQLNVLLIITMLFVTSCIARKNNKDTLSKKHQETSLSYYYSFLDTTNPNDSIPSECDCDYHSIGLYLMQDSTFTFRDQKGRLEILSLITKYGTWERQNNDMLILHLDSITTTFKDGTTVEKFSPPEDTDMTIQGKSYCMIMTKNLPPVGKRWKWND